MTETEERLVGLAEAAAMLGVCTETLRHWDNEGKLRAVKTVGGHRRYRLSDIRRRQQQPPNHEGAVYSLVLTDSTLLTPLVEWARLNNFGIKLPDGDVYNCQCEVCKTGREYTKEIFGD
jgi:excisionase family DNA binding protein